MKIVQLHNIKRFGGGDGVVFSRTCSILRSGGHEVIEMTRDSRHMKMTLQGKMAAFFSSIHSRSASREMHRLLAEKSPDLVHVHNLYPFFSTSVLAACRQHKIPVLFHCHSYFLTCPLGYHFHRGRTCARCRKGNVLWCIFHNCRQNLLESIALASQHVSAKKNGIFSDLVGHYISPTRFSREWLVESGLPSAKVVAIPNPIPYPLSSTDPAQGSYIAFAGRFSPEKGFDILLAAIRKTGLPLHVAGEFPRFDTDSTNVVWRGLLDSKAMDEFYRSARFLVVPSLWFETFALVAGEAMGHGIPVIASRIGALSEVVDEGITGLLFNPGDSDNLAEKMAWLWQHPEECQRMGAAGREKVKREFAPEQYRRHLLELYHKAIGS